MSALWLVMLSTTAAAEAQPLRLDEVLSAAERAFPSMVAARADLDGAEGDVLQAAGAFDPVWRTRGTGVPLSGYPQVRVDTGIDLPTPLWGSSFYAGWRLGTGKFQPYYGSRETWSAGELRAGASVPLLRNGPVDRRRTNIARTELGRSVAEQGVAQQRLEVLRMASIRYWDWVAAGQRHAVAVALLELARTRDAQLRARLTLGDAAKFDQQDNLRALLQREALVAQLRRSFEQASFELSLYLRDAEGRPMAVSPEQLPSLPPFESEEAVEPEVVLERRPDVARLKDQRKSAALEVTLQENQLLPGLDLGVAVSKDLGVSPRPDVDALGPTELEVNLSFELPVLWRAPRGRLQSARAAVSKLDAQLQLARERVAVELNDARSAMRLAQARFEVTEREVEAAAEVERLERERFQLGEGSLLFVNLREQGTAEARLRRIDALLDGHRAVAMWRAAAASFPSAP